jgi:adenosylcobinamide-GDP ribazoletransferase
MLRRLRDSLLVALGFLTILPVGGRVGVEESAGRWATAWFPVVGLLIGALLYVAMSLPVPAIPRAAFVLALWVGVSGGLHEDGWTDCLDAAFAPTSRARRLEILKDPHIGAHGASGLTILLLLRFAGLTAVPASAVLAAPVVGRWAMVLALALATPARPTGLGARFAVSARPGATTLATAITLGGLALVFSPGRLLAAWSLGAVTGWACALFLSRRFGGLTGDGYGAVGLATELAALWAFLPWPFSVGAQH